MHSKRDLQVRRGKVSAKEPLYTSKRDLRHGKRDLRHGKRDLGHGKRDLQVLRGKVCQGIRTIFAGADARGR